MFYERAKLPVKGPYLFSRGLQSDKANYGKPTRSFSQDTVYGLGEGAMVLKCYQRKKGEKMIWNGR